LPGLVERSLARDWRVVLQFTRQDSLEMIDTKLWTFSDSSFMAHSHEEDEFMHLQPVFLTLDAQLNPNVAHIRFCCEGAHCPDFQLYQRLVVMFDGHDEEQLEKARIRWRDFKASGEDVTYWQQKIGGGWEKKG